MPRRRPDLVELLRFIRGELSDHDSRRLALEVMDDPTLVDWVRWLSQVDDTSAALAFDQVPPPVTSALHALFAEHDAAEVEALLRVDSRREMAGARSPRLDGSYTLLLTSGDDLVVCDVFVDGRDRWVQVEVVGDDGSSVEIRTGWIEAAGVTTEGEVVAGRLELRHVPTGSVELHLRHARGRTRAVFEEGW